MIHQMLSILDSQSIHKIQTLVESILNEVQKVRRKKVVQTLAEHLSGVDGENDGCRPVEEGRQERKEQKRFQRHTFHRVVVERQCRVDAVAGCWNC